MPDGIGAGATAAGGDGAVCVACDGAGPNEQPDNAIATVRIAIRIVITALPPLARLPAL